MRTARTGRRLGLVALMIPMVGSAAAIGPVAYQQASDSPFYGQNFGYFHLENVEDGLINTPGLAVTGPSLFIAGPGGLADSVDADDGTIDGSGTGGRSIWTAGSTTLTFDASVLGALPNAVGLVWTDGLNPILFEVFDQDGILLGTIAGDHADGVFSGSTAEDRFYGWTVTSGGISSVRISNPPGTEVDHLQYGLTGQPPQVSEPGTLVLLGLGLAGLGFSRRRIPN